MIINNDILLPWGMHAKYFNGIKYSMLHLKLLIEIKKIQQYTWIPVNSTSIRINQQFKEKTKCMLHN